MNAAKRKISFEQSLAQHKLIEAEQAVDEIDKLVSLTFDEDPRIRKSVAHDLSMHSQDPRALLALLELSSDKDEQTSSIAKQALGTYKQADAEAFTSLEKFFTDARKEVPESPQEFANTNQRLLPSLEKLFSKNMSSREKLLPSIMKLFGSQHHPHSQQTKISEAAHDELEHIDFVHSKKAILDNAEKSVGIPIRMQNPTEIHEKRAAQKQAYSASPTAEQMEEAANFPLPEHLQSKFFSPVASIPIIGEGEIASGMNEADEYLPVSRLDYYKWAYAIAMTPGVSASDLKKEKLRLITEAKQSIELAFKLAVKRAKDEGIESLAGLKPGMGKLSTLPLEVLEHKLITIPKGKTKTIEMSRLLLSDGKHSIPLYVLPSRAHGIKTGDLVSVSRAIVDYQIKNPTAQTDAEKGEIILSLSKNGQLTITK